MKGIIFWISIHKSSSWIGWEVIKFWAKQFKIVEACWEIFILVCSFFKTDTKQTLIAIIQRYVRRETIFLSTVSGKKCNDMSYGIIDRSRMSEVFSLTEAKYENWQSVNDVKRQDFGYGRNSEEKDCHGGVRSLLIANEWLNDLTWVWRHSIWPESLGHELQFARRSLAEAARSLFASANLLPANKSIIMVFL